MTEKASGKPQASQPPRNAFKQFKRVLVLAGGGAKGAYAFGCLKAFRQHGVEFDAVAGTSVGTLNALIWATGAFDAGNQMWKNLSFHNVYPVRLFDPECTPKWVIRLSASLYVIARLIWASLHRIPTPYAVICQVSSVLVFVAGPFGLMLFAVRSDPNLTGRMLLVYVAVLLAISCLAFFCLRSRRLNGQLVFVGIVGFLACVPTFFLIDQLFHGAAWYWSLLFFLSGITLTFGAGSGVYYILSQSLGPDKSVLASAPLERSLTEILKTNTFTIPCFATAARMADVFDPDAGMWHTKDVNANGIASPGSLWEPDLERVWVPEYKRIDVLASRKAVQFCLASAALPFGIVPHIEIDGTDYVDGGVIDNVPFFPFVQDYPAKEIFVILLEPFSNDSAALKKADLTIARWSRLQRAKEVAAFNHPPPVRASTTFLPRVELPYKERNKPPRVIPFREPHNTPRMVVFYPKHSLGNFLKGTLNFEGEYAEKIMQQGLVDTCKKLNDAGPTSVLRNSNEI